MAYCIEVFIKISSPICETKGSTLLFSFYLFVTTVRRGRESSTGYMGIASQVQIGEIPVRFVHAHSDIPFKLHRAQVLAPET